jgi:hypothetical protein
VLGLRTGSPRCLRRNIYSDADRGLVKFMARIQISDLDEMDDIEGRDVCGGAFPGLIFLAPLPPDVPRPINVQITYNHFSMEILDLDDIGQPVDECVDPLTPAK